jgi:hypothetical protein
MQGNFSGKVDFSTPPGMADYYVFTDSKIIGYFNDLGPLNQLTLGFFDKNGILNDSVPSLFPKLPPDAGDIEKIEILKGNSSYGNWAKAGVIMFYYKNDNRQFIPPNTIRLWNSNGNIRFKEDFVDTLYTVSGNHLIPSITFNTGKYHWPMEERLSTKNTKERIFISDVSENDYFVFFQCISGLYSNESVLYNGLYDKQTGKTKLSKFSNAIEDDLTQFMPFIPLGISTSGEFVSIVEAYKILEWMEEHPEAKNNDKLSFIKDLNEESNPVVILIE